MEPLFRRIPWCTNNATSFNHKACIRCALLDSVSVVTLLDSQRLLVVALQCKLSISWMTFTPALMLSLITLMSTKLRLLEMLVSYIIYYRCHNFYCGQILNHDFGRFKINDTYSRRSCLFKFTQILAHLTKFKWWFVKCESPFIAVLTAAIMSWFINNSWILRRLQTTTSSWYYYKH